ncbi:hypothetical protein [Pendulispora albinea]
MNSLKQSWSKARSQIAAALELAAKDLKAARTSIAQRLSRWTRLA